MGQWYWSSGRKVSNDGTERAVPAEDKEVGNEAQSESYNTAAVQQGEHMGREAS